MSPRIITAGLALVTLLGLVPAARGDDPAVKEALAKLLEVGWQNTIKARGAAAEHYEALQAAAPGDNRVTYAFALIQIKQRDYPHAIKLLDEVLAANKTDRFAIKSKSWLSVVTKNYAVALAELEKLSQLVPSDEATAEEEQNLELARYLGRVFGFLEGPVAEASHPAQRDQAKKRILARLSEPRKTAFEEGRARVLAAFNNLGSEKEESEEKAKVVAEDEREKLLKDLEGRKDQLAARRSEIGPRRDKLRSELQAEQAQAAKDEQPILSELNLINGQAAGAQRQRDIYIAELLQIRAQLDREKDPVIRERLRFELDRLNVLGARADATLVAIQRRAAGVNAQLATVQQRHAVAINRLTGDLNRLEAEVAALDKLERRTDIDTTKAKKPAVGDVRRSRSLSAQATALSTYEEFPLEAERQRLLDSYK